MREKKILVIDDDEMNLQIAKMILERKLPCKVVVADNGLDGLEILRKQHVSLVLLDIMMPYFDGIETLQEIRADSRIKDVPIMMLTASGDIENIQKVGLLGVTDYIKKPFLPADLVERVSKKIAGEDYSEILIYGDDEEILQEMRTIIEKNFPHEVFVATSIPKVKTILNETKIELIIGYAEMKFIRGLKFMSFLSANKDFDEIPLAVTTPDKLLELVEKLDLPLEEKISEPVVDEVAESEVVHGSKKKFGNVVTTLIGYDLEVKV